MGTKSEMGCSVDIDLDLQSGLMREKLARLYRYAQVGLCVSSVTHDVNNLLGAIMAYAELVGMDSSLSSDSGRMLAEIVGAVRRSSVLVNNLTDVARKDRADVRIIDPSNLMERVLDLRRYDLKVAHITLTCEYQPGMVNFAVDLPRLQQSMMYIVSNTVEALESEKQACFEARVRMEDSWVSFSFRDSATPIPLSHRDRIFEPFFTTKGADHMGLGLTIARATAEDHGGELVYDPRAGFVMRLPTNNRYSSQV